MDEEEQTELAKIHQRMIYRLNEKMRQNKMINGRFFSPTILQRKASKFQR